MRAYSTSRLLALSIGLFTLPALPAAASAQAQPAPRLRVSGDVRSGYFNLHRQDRTGATATTDDFRVRPRIGVGLRLSDAFSARVRFAGRFSTEQERTTFYIRDHVPNTDGLRLGEATLDEAYLNYRASERLNVRAGRMQTKFALADLMEKSLDRVDSPNTDVTWTDGAHVTLSAAHGWRAHVLLQHNAPAGSTNHRRAPLAFTDSRSRITWFTAVENATPWGPVVQRALDLTYAPRSLRADGDATERPEDYVAVVARGAVALPVGPSRLLLGGEAGYAPNTPTRQGLGLPGSGDTGGVAYQVGVTLDDAIRSHRFGILYGYTEAGWLIAPDFRNNDRLLEGRYKWALARNQTLDARVRLRRDLEQLLAASQKREDIDVYVRFTWRF
jgi:hypothetical protein